MNTKKVLENYAFVANISNEEALKKYPLASLSIARVTSFCKNEIEPKDEPILSMLCACLINLWVQLSNASSSSTGSFRGNGYAITKDSTKEIYAAKEVFDRWRSECAYLLKDEDFAFYSTKKVKETEEDDDESKS